MDLKLLTAKNVEAAPEILIYFMIQSLGDFIFAMRRAVTHYGAKETDLLTDVANAHHDQKELVDILKKRDGFAFADHAEYMTWFRWWHEWHKSSLTDDQWKQLNSLLEWDGTQTEETFAAWRPSGTWKSPESQQKEVLS